MKPKIAIITQSHLCRNPRVLKEARVLSTEGYEVHILNVAFSAALKETDLGLIRDYPSMRVQAVADLAQNNIAAIADRLLFKLGRLLVKYLKIETPLALGYGALKYRRKCKAVKAGLYICHQEMATYTGKRLIKSGYQVAFDFEDWYSADLLPEARNTRPLRLLRRIEKFALNKGTFCTTTSAALAKKMAAVYAGAEPKVIYNVFPVEDELLKKEKQFQEPLKLFWFSQTIGPGRGLEEFIACLAQIITGVELHLLGHIDESYRHFLSGRMPGQHRLQFHPMVPEPELAKVIAGFDIGLALELPEPPSRNLTITNKFFQYLESGLPVIATETAGQKEIFEKFNCGFLLAQNATPDDIHALGAWLMDTTALKRSRAIAQSAAYCYSWENESKKLLDMVKNAYGSKG